MIALSKTTVDERPSDHPLMRLAVEDLDLITLVLRSRSRDWPRAPASYPLRSRGQGDRAVASVERERRRTRWSSSWETRWRRRVDDLARAVVILPARGHLEWPGGLTILVACRSGVLVGCVGVDGALLGVGGAIVGGYLVLTEVADSRAGRSLELWLIANRTRSIPDDGRRVVYCVIIGLIPRRPTVVSYGTSPRAVRKMRSPLGGEPSFGAAGGAWSGRRSRNGSWE